MSHNMPIPNALIDPRIAQLNNEKKGFPIVAGQPDRTSSEVLFVNGTRTLTIQPKAPATSFIYYSNGIELTVDAPITFVIPNTDGIKYVYLDENKTLQQLGAQNTEFLFRQAMVAAIYWNVATQTAVFFGEERHSTIDAGALMYADTFGMTYVSGFGITFPSTSYDGTSNDDVKFTLDEGVILDDLIRLEISAGTSTIPVYVKNAGVWSKVTNSGYAIQTAGTGRLAYNPTNAGLAECPDDTYCVYTIFATNCTIDPIIAVPGIVALTQIGDGNAQINTQLKDLDLVTEFGFTPLYALMYHTKDTYTNATKSTLSITYKCTDLRTFCDNNYFSGITVNTINTPVDKAVPYANANTLITNENFVFDQTTQILSVPEIKCSNMQLGDFMEKSLGGITWVNTTANQKCDIEIPAAIYNFNLEITVVSDNTYANATGTVIKSIDAVTTASAVTSQVSSYTHVGNYIKTHFAISDLIWDAVKSKFIIKIVNRTNYNNGTQVKIKISRPSSTSILPDVVLSAVYTTDTDVYATPFLQTEGSKVWTAANDGTGSTLDADLLDGKEATAFVLVDGTQALTGTLNSTLAIGTAPITVTSTTKCTNLNADLLDDKSSAAFVLVDGTQSMTGALNSTLAIGTAPITVTSTTMCTNLNADTLDGQHYTDITTYISNTNNFLTPSIPNKRGDVFSYKGLKDYINLNAICRNFNAEITAYAHGVTAVTNAYIGGVYSPTQNRIYLGPASQANQTDWHYIDCATGTVTAYAHGVTAVASAYYGCIYSPTQNRIYLVPYKQAPETNWHYIDCATGVVTAYAHGATVVAGAHVSGVYSPTQNRIYFVPRAQAVETNWHYINCDTGVVAAYVHGATVVANGYSGGIYSPTQNRIYFVPLPQANQTNWHYVDMGADVVGSKWLASNAMFNKL